VCAANTHVHYTATHGCIHAQVFVPTKDTSDISSLLKYRWFAAGWLAVQSLLGWPMYLLWNASGREYSKFTSHFDPFSPIFSRRERPGVSHRQGPAVSAGGVGAQHGCVCRTACRW
jgi:hypothetical protein